MTPQEIRKSFGNEYWDVPYIKPDNFRATVHAYKKLYGHGDKEVLRESIDIKGALDRALELAEWKKEGKEIEGIEFDPFYISTGPSKEWGARARAVAPITPGGGTVVPLVAAAAERGIQGQPRAGRGVKRDFDVPSGSEPWPIVVGSTWREIDGYDYYTFVMGLHGGNEPESVDVQLLPDAKRVKVLSKWPGTYLRAKQMWNMTKDPNSPVVKRHPREIALERRIDELKKGASSVSSTHIVDLPFQVRPIELDDWRLGQNQKGCLCVRVTAKGLISGRTRTRKKCFRLNPPLDESSDEDTS